MRYVLVRVSDGAFVARVGHSGSYTRDLRAARVYASEESARADACGNEVPRNVYDLLEGR
jgi:hypothetical protein